MKVSFDGLRQNLMSDVKELKETIQELESTLTGFEFECLSEKFDLVAQGANILMCIYDDNVEGDCNNLSGDVCDYILD